MALRNRQDGKVEVWVGAQRAEGNAKNIIEFDELALTANVTAAIAAAITSATGKQALLTTLGIPGPYADDSAAKAATPAVPVGGVYYVTTTLKLATVMA